MPRSKSKACSRSLKHQPGSPMPGLSWLTAQPIAHRGLHDAAKGVVENTATAFTAAVANGFGIETDLQISADGEAMVHHDDALGRLTEGSQPLAAITAAAIKAVRFKATSDRILTLAELCALVAGRAPIAAARRIAPKLTRGIVAERHYTHHEWDRLSTAEKFRLSFLLHAPQTRPQFLA